MALFYSELEDFYFPVATYLPHCLFSSSSENCHYSTDLDASAEFVLSNVAVIGRVALFKFRTTFQLS